MGQTTITPKLRRIVVVTKSTCKEIHAENKQPSVESVLHPEFAQAANERADLAHDEHHATLDIVQQILNKYALSYRKVSRDDSNYILPLDTDLVITVGGDGTFLATSHFVSSRQGTAILGVMSSSTSIGHYCLANASNFAEIFDKLVLGALQPTPILRLSATLNGKELPLPVLNEVTVTDERPVAGTAKYTLLVGNEHQVHASFGLIVSTPSGSTGSYCSAGGKVLNVYDRNFGYQGLGIVSPPNKTIILRSGTLTESDEVYVRSEMDTGKIFIDGKYLCYEFIRGSELVVSTSEELDLLAYVNRDCNLPYMK